MRGSKLVAATGLLVLVAQASMATTPCTTTGFTQTNFYTTGANLTARLFNPPGTVSGDVDATGCDIGVYYGSGITGTVSGANIHGANVYGVVNKGGNVTVTNSTISDIGNLAPDSGTSFGYAIYFARGTNAQGSITNNTVWNYQKNGIVVAGPNPSVVTISGNNVIGQGQTARIAQNGILLVSGANAKIENNIVSGHAFIDGDNTGSGILLYGGPADAGPHVIGTIIDNNFLVNNDVAVSLSNYNAAASGPPPSTNTNVSVHNNTIRSNVVSNEVYQAGIAAEGRKDAIYNNDICGLGYVPQPGYVFFIDASPSEDPGATISGNTDCGGPAPATAAVVRATPSAGGPHKPKP